MLPRPVRDEILVVLEKSGKKLGLTYGSQLNPDFARQAGLGQNCQVTFAPNGRFVEIKVSLEAQDRPELRARMISPFLTGLMDFYEDRVSIKFINRVKLEEFRAFHFELLAEPT